MANIHISNEDPRGCGYRQPGGVYLRSSGKGFPCGLLPIPFKTCGCCGHIETFSRSLKWVQMAYISYCIKHEKEHCEGVCGLCPFTLMEKNVERVAVDWVGASHYKETEHFNKEAEAMGISRRVPIKIKTDKKGKVSIQFPLKDFEVGKDWIGLAHSRAHKTISTDGKIDAMPGIFKMWKPDVLEYVVAGHETEDFLDQLEKLKVRLVKVIPNYDEGEQTDLFNQ